MSKTKSAFEKTAELAIQDAINAVKADILGIPYTKLEWPKIKHFIFRCTKTHKYTIDAGIAGVEQFYVFGEVRGFTDNSTHSMDSTKWELIGEVEK